MQIKKQVLLCLILLSGITVMGWAQMLYTEGTSYTWANKTSVPVYLYIPGGQGITSAELDVALGNTNPHEYFLTYPDGTTDYIPVGTVVSTYNLGTGSGYSVSFLKTTTAGTYKLTIRKDPAGTVAFVNATVFGLTLDQLGAVNALTATVAFYGPAPITPPAGIIPNGVYWVDNSSGATTATAYFQLRGADATGTVHRVNLWFISDTTPLSYSLRANTRGSQLATSTVINLPNQISINQDIGGSAGVHVELHSHGSGLYQMEIVGNPASCPLAGTDCEFDENEYWQFTINFSSGHTTVMSMQPLSYNSSAVSQDLLVLYRPPVAVIRNPGNIDADAASPVVVSRNFRYTSDPFDADTADSSLGYQWQLDGTNFAAHGTEQNPDFDASFGTTGSHNVSLSVSETYTISGTFPYANFTQSSTDKLSLDVVNPEYILFPPHRNLPYVTGYPPPTIDGDVNPTFTDTSLTSSDIGDTGWNQAHMIAYQDGSLPHVLVQTLRDKNAATPYLYFSFEVRNDSSIDQYDAILLALSPDNSAATKDNDRILLVYPFSSSPSTGTSLVPNQVKLKRWNSGTSTWDSTTLTYNAGPQTYDYNIQVKVKNFGGATGAWNMEMRIPLTDAIAGGTGNWVDFTTDKFLLMYTLFRADTTGGTPVITEFRWPRNSEDMLGDIETYDYNPAWWSIAEKGSITLSNYNGLFFDPSTILVTPKVGGNPTGAAGNTIVLPNCGDADANNDSVLNTFQVTLRNNAFVKGDYRALQDIKIAFRVATWGIAGVDSWILVPSYLDVPATNNPLGGISISAGDGTDAATQAVNLPWTIDCTSGTAGSGVPDDLWARTYYPGTHHCVYVEILEAAVSGVSPPTAANVLISRAYRNFNFVTASEYREKAVIDTKGNGNPPDGSDKFRYRINVTKHEWAVKKTDPDSSHAGLKSGDLRVLGAGAGNQGESDTDSYLYWSASGYVATGRTVILRNTPLELYDPTGSFGLVAQHKAEVMEWGERIDGADAIGPDTYEFELDVDSTKDLMVVVKPFEPTGLTISLHAGAAVPLANFTNSYSTGFCGILDIGYKFSPNIAVIFYAGYNYLPGANAAVLPTSIINLALNFRYTLPINRQFFAYAQLGPDFYIQDFTTMAFGYNGGLGVGMVLSPRFDLELGADYHSTFTQQNWLLQAHLGIILKL